MKTLLTIIALFTITFSFASEKPVKDTTIKNVSYTIYEGAKGGRFIKKISASGKEYKQYLSSIKETANSASFYDGEGNVIPTEAVYLLVRSQFIVMTATEKATIKKYFYFSK